MENNPLMSALVQGTNLENVVAKAEDIQTGGGLDFSKIFFEPQPNCDYLIKFLPNLSGNPITHRSQYRNLPDPDRKGKTFRWTSSGSAQTDPVLQLFFDLHAEMKNGNKIAEMKIQKYLKNTNQAACVVQILQSPNKEEVGKFRIFAFSSYGENATVANLIKNKVSPSEKKLALGEKPEDIFNVFGSSALYVVCKKVMIPQPNGPAIEGRGYSESSWMEKRPYGAIVTLEDGTQHEFSAADIDPATKSVKPEVMPFFNKLVEELQNPDISVHNYFAYCEPGDKRNTPETEEYLKKVRKKVEEIVPVIREKSLKEIEEYGRKDHSETGAGSKDGATTINGASAKDILAEAVPTEIQGSVMNQDAEKPQPAPAASKAADTDDIVSDILNS